MNAEKLENLKICRGACKRKKFHKNFSTETYISDVHLVDIIGELFCTEREGVRFEKYSVFNPFQLDLDPLSFLETSLKLIETTRIMQILEAVFSSERLQKLELKGVFILWRSLKIEN